MNKLFIILPFIAACSNDVPFVSNTPNLVELNSVKTDDQIYPSELVNQYFHYVEYSDLGFSYSRNHGLKLEENGKWDINIRSWSRDDSREWYLDKSNNSLILLYNNRTAHVFKLKDGIWCSNYGCLLSRADYLKFEQGKPLNINSKQGESEPAITSSGKTSTSNVKSEAKVDIQLVPKSNDSRILNSPDFNSLHPDWMPPSYIGLSFTFIAKKEINTIMGVTYYQGDLLGSRGSLVTENCYIKADEWE